MGVYVFLLRKSKPVKARVEGIEGHPEKVLIHRLEYLCKPWRNEFCETNGVPPMLHMQRKRAKKIWEKHREKHGNRGVYFAILDMPHKRSEYDCPDLKEGDCIYYADRPFSEWWDTVDFPNNGRKIGEWRNGRVVKEVVDAKSVQ